MTPSKTDRTAKKRSLSSSLPRSRAEAIERGELVDVTGLAADKRFTVSVALTAEVFEDVRDLSSHYILSSDTADTRLDNLLDYARGNVAENEHRSSFEFSFYMPTGDHTIYTASLRLMAGDEPDEYVITISKAEEDSRPR